MGIQRQRAFRGGYEREWLGETHLSRLMLLVKHAKALFEVAGSREKRGVTGRGCNPTPADCRYRDQQLPAEPCPGFPSGQKLPLKPLHKRLLGNLWLGGGEIPEGFYF